MNGCVNAVLRIGNAACVSTSGSCETQKVPRSRAVVDRRVALRHFLLVGEEALVVLVFEVQARREPRDAQLLERFLAHTCICKHTHANLKNEE